MDSRNYLAFFMLAVFGGFLFFFIIWPILKLLLTIPFAMAGLVH